MQAQPIRKQPARKKSALGWCMELAALGILGAVALPGCGVGYQHRYASEVNFEHCYRLDSDSKIAPARRQRCWHNWLASYGQGAQQDRRVYARKRESELRAHGSREPVLRVAKPSSGPRPAHAIRASQLSLTPSPKTAERERGGPTTYQACVADCAEDFKTCGSRCNDNRCVEHCGRATRFCVALCLE